jgi:hypothetical protein
MKFVVKDLFSGSAEKGEWLSWHRRERTSGQRREGNRYKLYVSPIAEDVREAFTAVARNLGGSGATAFKIGPNAHGLLRPDKMVVYFDARAELHAFGATLARDLAGVRPHGVPFSAELAEGGLLSWGVDPARDGITVGTYVDESWRIWICNRLAVALVSAKASAPAMAPWRCALARLWLLGVDSRTWTPRAPGGA